MTAHSGCSYSDGFKHECALPAVHLPAILQDHPCQADLGHLWPLAVRGNLENRQEQSSCETSLPNPFAPRFKLTEIFP